MKSIKKVLFDEVPTVFVVDRINYSDMENTENSEKVSVKERTRKFRKIIDPVNDEKIVVSFVMLDFSVSRRLLTNWRMVKTTFRHSVAKLKAKFECLRHKISYNLSQGFFLYVRPHPDVFRDASYLNLNEYMNSIEFLLTSMKETQFVFFVQTFLSTDILSFDSFLEFIRDFGNALGTQHRPTHVLHGLTKKWSIHKPLFAEVLSYMFLDVLRLFFLLNEVKNITQIYVNDSRKSVAFHNFLP